MTAANALINPQTSGYVSTGTVASLLMQRVKFTSTASPLWEGNILDGTISGFRSMSSSQMPTDNMLFGDWSQVVIGEWGVLELVVNPYTSFQAGIVGVRAMHSVDVAVRHPASFSLATGIT